MRNLTEDEKKLWNDVTRTVHPIDDPTPVPFSRVRNRPPAAEPAMVLDLHNMTLDDAYTASLSMIADARALGVRSVMIITGLSGRIRAEFPIWMERASLRELEVLNGGGAFRCHLSPKARISAGRVGRPT